MAGYCLKMSCWLLGTSRIVFNLRNFIENETFAESLLSTLILARTQINLSNDSLIKESQEEKKSCNSGSAFSP
jgi:hypothetical protein